MARLSLCARETVPFGAQSGPRGERCRLGRERRPHLAQAVEHRAAVLDVADRQRHRVGRAATVAVTGLRDPAQRDIRRASCTSRQARAGR